MLQTRESKGEPKNERTSYLHAYILRLAVVFPPPSSILDDNPFPLTLYSPRRHSRIRLVGYTPFPPAFKRDAADPLRRLVHVLKDIEIFGRPWPRVHPHRLLLLLPLNIYFAPAVPFLLASH
jgi:hypothetical protein